MELANDEDIDKFLETAPDSFFEPVKEGECAQEDDVDDDEQYMREPHGSGDEAVTPPATVAAKIPTPVAAATTTAAKIVPAVNISSKKLMADMLDKAQGEASRSEVVVLDEYQKRALEASLSGKHMLITGPAGCGKSVLLREINRLASEQGIVVSNVAHNGIAAANINGMTIHSFAGLGQQKKPPYEVKGEARERIKETKKLIIDEISTVSNHMFDGLDLLFREVLEKPDEPFGGIQIIACGDLAQLKPIDDSKKQEETRKDMARQGQKVVDNSEENYRKLSPEKKALLTKPSAQTDFVWSANAWKYIKDNVFLLHKPHRQATDPRFLKLLEEARIAQLSEESDKFLLDKVKDYKNNIKKVPDSYTMLCSKNEAVRDYNQERLNALPAQTGRKFVSLDYFKPCDKPTDFFKKFLTNIPAPNEFEARLGSRVLLKKNMTKELVNGSCGTVVGWTCHFVSDGRVARPIRGLVFSNPGVIRTIHEIKPYKDLELHPSAKAVTLSFTDQTIHSLEDQRRRVKSGMAEKEDSEAHLFGLNGFLPLPVVFFDNGEHVVCTPSKWSVEVKRREEIPEHEQRSDASESTQQARKLARITAVAADGSQESSLRSRVGGRKKYRTVPEELAWRIQLPLQLAWAISIHASQGITVTKLAVDLGPSLFDPGQAYVALSRGTTSEKLIITSYIRSKIRANPDVTRYYNQLKARTVAALRKPDTEKVEEVIVDDRSDSELTESERSERFKRMMNTRAKRHIDKALEEDI